ncbi:hypothetical protein C8R43DRAFT_1112238 [Mycena crocata]|nr:hypothetical protein C8R43DRAFT_1112238 [Mycena crocata]
MGIKPVGCCQCSDRVGERFDIDAKFKYVYDGEEKRGPNAPEEALSISYSSFIHSELLTIMPKSQAKGASSAFCGQSKDDASLPGAICKTSSPEPNGVFGDLVHFRQLNGVQRCQLGLTVVINSINATEQLSVFLGLSPRECMYSSQALASRCRITALCNYETLRTRQMKRRQSVAAKSDEIKPDSTQEKKILQLLVVFAMESNLDKFITVTLAVPISGMF